MSAVINKFAIAQQIDHHEWRIRWDEFSRRFESLSRNFDRSHFFSPVAFFRGSQSVGAVEHLCLNCREIDTVEAAKVDADGRFIFQFHVDR